MNDKKWIIAGLIVAVGIFSFPLWYNHGKKGSALEVILAPKAKAAGQCILPAKDMRIQHMQILDQWREDAVRGIGREYTSPTGVKWDMSLSNTCLDCHSNREQFCDKCHSYASVRTYCWDCHVNPSKW